MRTVWNPVFFIVAMLIAFIGACEGGPYLDALPVTMVEVNQILDDEDLTPEQRRARLEARDLPPQVINALLEPMEGAELVNQFGGDLRSAYEKLATERFEELTPDEVQIYANEVREIDASASYTLTDQEAVVIVHFFQKHYISSRDELAEFLGDPGQAAWVPSYIPDGALNDLFVSFDFEQLLERLP